MCAAVQALSGQLLLDIVTIYNTLAPSAQHLMPSPDCAHVEGASSDALVLLFWPIQASLPMLCCHCPWLVVVEVSASFNGFAN